MRSPIRYLSLLPRAKRINAIRFSRLISTYLSAEISAEVKDTKEREQLARVCAETLLTFRRLNTRKSKSLLDIRQLWRRGLITQDQSEYLSEKIDHEFREELVSVFL